jgi:hypothetical protein
MWGMSGSISSGWIMKPSLIMNPPLFNISIGYIYWMISAAVITSEQMTAMTMIHVRWDRTTSAANEKEHCPDLI